jgi:hypothetical protein
MAVATCIKCGGHSFELALFTPLGESHKLTMVQCGARTTANRCRRWLAFAVAGSTSPRSYVWFAEGLQTEIVTPHCMWQTSCSSWSGQPGGGI